jgi:hypothetical protein
MQAGLGRFEAAKGLHRNSHSSLHTPQLFGRHPNASPAAPIRAITLETVAVGTPITLRLIRAKSPFRCPSGRDTGQLAPRRIHRPDGSRRPPRLVYRFLAGTSPRRGTPSTSRRRASRHAGHPGRAVARTPRSPSAGSHRTSRKDSRVWACVGKASSVSVRTGLRVRANGVTRDHGVVEAIVREARMRVDAGVGEAGVLIAAKREHRLVHLLGVEDLEAHQ